MNLKWNLEMILVKIVSGIILFFLAILIYFVIPNGLYSWITAKDNSIINYLIIGGIIICWFGLVLMIVFLFNTMFLDSLVQFLQ